MFVAPCEQRALTLCRGGGGERARFVSCAVSIADAIYSFVPRIGREETPLLLLLLLVRLLLLLLRLWRRRRRPSIGIVLRSFLLLLGKEADGIK